MLAKALNTYLRAVSFAAAVFRGGIMNVKPLEEISAFLQPYAEEVGVELVDVEWNDKECALTVFIETENGIDLDTCEKFHNAIMEPIDELDPTYDKPYTLNVSSPGLDRPFKTQRDFERNVGKEVEVKLYAPMKGEKFLEGFLTAFDLNSVTIKTQKEELKISRNKIAKISRAIKFD